MGEKETSAPALVMGGAGFSYQLHPDPESLPVRQILLRAFDLGVRTIDTSPYYEPSEQLMGAALSHQEITSKYAREDFVLMTKVGRITEKQFDYSPDWIRKSVARSLQRFQTSYLDVVFCHDVEFVSVEEAVRAVGVLFELAATGVIQRVGISGYEIDTLSDIANLVAKTYDRSIDVIQCWAKLTLQNTEVEHHGFEAFRGAGVKAAFCSSPLAVGLLRHGGIPDGRTGDWHPAPQALRSAAQEAAEWVAKQGEKLSSIALRYAIAKARQNCAPGFAVSTISGISSISELEQNVAAAKMVLQTTGDPAMVTLDQFRSLNEEAVASIEPLFTGVRAILGPWVDYDFNKREIKLEQKKEPQEATGCREGGTVKPLIRASI